VLNVFLIALCDLVFLIILFIKSDAKLAMIIPSTNVNKLMSNIFIR